MGIQYSKLFLIGVPVGVVGGMIASFFTIISFLCCVANLVGYLGPTVSGAIAALIAAMLVDLSMVEKGKEVSQSAMAGMAAGGIAAITCAIIL